MERLNFNPQNGFKDVSAFPNPQNGDETRNQLNELHMQTKDFINNTLKPVVDGLETTSAKGITSSDGSVDIVKTNNVYDLKVSVKGGGATVAYVDQKSTEALNSAKTYSKDYADGINNQLSDRISAVDTKLGGSTLQRMTDSEWEALDPKPELGTLSVVRGD